MKGVLILAHGSRVKSTKDTINKVADMNSTTAIPMTAVTDSRRKTERAAYGRRPLRMTRCLPVIRIFTSGAIRSLQETLLKDAESMLKKRSEADGDCSDRGSSFSA
jgi:hypothetical protein